MVKTILQSACVGLSAVVAAALLGIFVGLPLAGFFLSRNAPPGGAEVGWDLVTMARNFSPTVLLFSSTKLPMCAPAFKCVSPRSRAKAALTARQISAPCVCITRRGRLAPAAPATQRSRPSRPIRSVALEQRARALLQLLEDAMLRRSIIAPSRLKCRGQAQPQAGNSPGTISSM